MGAGGSAAHQRADGPPPPGTDPVFDKMVEDELARRKDQGGAAKPGASAPPVPGEDPVFDAMVKQEMERQKYEVDAFAGALGARRRGPRRAEVATRLREAARAPWRASSATCAPSATPTGPRLRPRAEPARAAPYGGAAALGVGGQPWRPRRDKQRQYAAALRQQMEAPRRSLRGGDDDWQRAPRRRRWSRRAATATLRGARRACAGGGAAHGPPPWAHGDVGRDPYEPAPLGRGMATIQGANPRAARRRAGRAGRLRGRARGPDAREGGPGPLPPQPRHGREPRAAGATRRARRATTGGAYGGGAHGAPQQPGAYGGAPQQPGAYGGGAPQGAYGGGAPQGAYGGEPPPREDAARGTAGSSRRTARAAERARRFAPQRLRQQQQQQQEQEPAAYGQGVVDGPSARGATAGGGDGRRRREAAPEPPARDGGAYGAHPGGRDDEPAADDRAAAGRTRERFVRDVYGESKVASAFGGGGGGAEPVGGGITRRVDPAVEAKRRSQALAQREALEAQIAARREAKEAEAAERRRQEAADLEEERRRDAEEKAKKDEEDRVKRENEQRRLDDLYAAQEAAAKKRRNQDRRDEDDDDDGPRGPPRRGGGRAPRTLRRRAAPGAAAARRRRGAAAPGGGGAAAVAAAAAPGRGLRRGRLAARGAAAPRARGPERRRGAKATNRYDDERVRDSELDKAADDFERRVAAELERFQLDRERREGRKEVARRAEPSGASLEALADRFAPDATKPSIYDLAGVEPPAPVKDRDVRPPPEDWAEKSLAGNSSFVPLPADYKASAEFDGLNPAAREPEMNQVDEYLSPDAIADRWQRDHPVVADPGGAPLPNPIRASSDPAKAAASTAKFTGAAEQSLVGESVFHHFHDNDGLAALSGPNSLSPPRRAAADEPRRAAADEASDRQARKENILRPKTVALPARRAAAAGTDPVFDRMVEAELANRVNTPRADGDPPADFFK
ncbi:Rad9 [Aureococcus anophagefferens]|nr:Rad9 [Aureococcus anophagefferens]